MRLPIGVVSVALALTIASSAALAATIEFVDVPDTHWAHDPIVAMAERGVVKGVGENRFAPSGTVTCAEFVTMLTREFCEAKDDPAAETWYAPYMAVARDEGLLDGCGDLAPTEKIDRYDMAQVMYNLIKDTDMTLPQGVQPPDWDRIPENYREAVSVCYALELLKGRDESGSFEGSATMSRAEAATVVDRLFSKDIHPNINETESAAVEVPSDARYITADDIIEYGGASGSESYFDPSSNTMYFRYEGETPEEYIMLRNTGYSKITFTIAVHKDAHTLRVKGEDGYRADIRLSRGQPDSLLEPEKEYTFTVDISGITDLCITSISNGLSNADIYNMYFHN